MKTKFRWLISLTAVSTALCLLCGCSKATNTEPFTMIGDIANTQSITGEVIKSSDIESIVNAGVNTSNAKNDQSLHFSVVTDAAVLQDISKSIGFGGRMPEGMEFPEDMESPEGMPEGMEPPAGMQRPEGMPEGKEPPAGIQPPEGMPEGMEPPAGMQPPEGMPGGMDFSEGMERPEGMPEGFGGFGGAPGVPGMADLSDAPLVIVISCKEGSESDANVACQSMSETAQLLGYGTKIISAPFMALNGVNQKEYRELLSIPENQNAVAFLLVVIGAA